MGNSVAHKPGPAPSGRRAGVSGSRPRPGSLLDGPVARRAHRRGNRQGPPRQPPDEDGRRLAVHPRRRRGPGHLAPPVVRRRPARPSAPPAASSTASEMARRPPAPRRGDRARYFSPFRNGWVGLFDEPNLSFPSGHTCLAFATAACLGISSRAGAMRSTPWPPSSASSAWRRTPITSPTSSPVPRWAPSRPISPTGPPAGCWHRSRMRPGARRGGAVVTERPSLDDDSAGLGPCALVTCRGGTCPPGGWPWCAPG